MKHAALLKSSGWTYSTRFRELEAAQAWGCPTPVDFDKMPKARREELVAWYISRNEKQAIDAYEQNEASKREAKKGRAKYRGKH